LSKTEQDIQDIIIKAKKGNQIAYSTLLDTFWNYVYGFQLKRTENENDAEDITMQTFSRTIIQTRENNEVIKKVLDDAPSAEDQLITEQNLATLLQHIKKLKPHYQEVINLRYFNELSYADIATQLNEPMNNIKVKLLRAKKLLAEVIKNK